MLSIDSMFKGTRNTPAKVPDTRSRAKRTNLDSGHFYAQRRHDRAPLNGGALVRVCQREAGIGRAAAGLRERASHRVSWKRRAVCTLWDQWLAGGLTTGSTGATSGATSPRASCLQLLNRRVQAQIRKTLLLSAAVKSVRPFSQLLCCSEDGHADKLTTGAGAHGLGPVPPAAWSTSSSRSGAA